MSSFCTPQLIATQCRYQLDLGNKMVALVIDSLDLSRGKLNLKAFRVNSRFVKLFDENKITFDEYLFYFLNLFNFSLQERQLSSSDILEEVKINLCVNELESVLLRQLELDSILREEEPVTVNPMFYLVRSFMRSVMCRRRIWSRSLRIWARRSANDTRLLRRDTERRRRAMWS